MKKKILAVAIMGLFASTAVMAATIGQVQDNQSSVENSVTSDKAHNKARAGKGSLNHASGNIGVNIAAGSGNQQTNATALATSSGRFVAAGVNASQYSAVNDTQGDQTRNMASGGKRVLNHAAGNIGVNVAAGNGNQQQNNLAVASQKGNDDRDPMASVRSQQATVLDGTLAAGYYYTTGSGNSASGGKGVMNHASGNIGANMAAGTGNQQANSVALANGAGRSVSAGVSSDQVSIINMTEDLGIHNTAAGGERVLNDAKGNIGVNIAAGASNQQQNNLALAKSQGGDEGAYATVDASQAAIFNSAARFSTANAADGGDNILNGATGNIGVNIAAGDGNQQANSLALAVQKGNGHDRDPAAVVNNGQVSGAYNGSFTLGGDNSATGGSSVLDDARGNIGVNIAAGTGNQQSNAVALASGDGNYAAAAIDSDQQSMRNSANANGAFNSAFGGIDMLNNAKGNIGVNMAAGAGNQQQNNLALARGRAEEEASTAHAGVTAHQHGSGNVTTQTSVLNQATGSIDGLDGARGNIGVNMAAGSGNQQANSLAIADARSPRGEAKDRDGHLHADDAYPLPLQSHQLSSHNRTTGDGMENLANGGFDSLNGASGNMGVNIAAGAGNQQANTTALAIADATHVKADPTLLQKSKSNHTTNLNGQNGASAGTAILNDARGNIGVNIAAGSGNQQANSLDIARNASDEDDLKVRAQAGADQFSHRNTTTNVTQANDASMGNDNLNGASGNIGVNIAAGTGNQQANQLALAIGTRSDEERMGTDAHLKARVADQQLSDDNRIHRQDTRNTASGGAYSLDGASGNIGVNIAAGTGNQQANAVALAKGDLVDAHAAATASQASLDNTADLKVGEDGKGADARNTNQATGGDHSLNHAHGNISVNVTAGTGNQQKNDLALAVYTGPEADATALASVTAGQVSQGNAVTNANQVNTASLGAGMLNGASGNISVNVSAGAFNQQANLLSIANTK